MILEEGCPVMPREGYTVIRGVCNIPKLALATDDIPSNTRFVFTVASEDNIVNHLKPVAECFCVGEKIVIAPFALAQLGAFKMDGSYINNERSYATFKKWYKSATPEEMKDLPNEVEFIEYFVFPTDNIIAKVICTNA